MSSTRRLRAGTKVTPNTCDTKPFTRMVESLLAVAVAPRTLERKCARRKKQPPRSGQDS